MCCPWVIQTEDLDELMKRKEANLQKQREIVRHVSKTVHKRATCHFSSCLICFYLLVFCNVLKRCTFIPASQGQQNRAFGASIPSVCLPIFHLIHPSLYRCQHSFTQLPLKLCHEGPGLSTRLIQNQNQNQSRSLLPSTCARTRNVTWYIGAITVNI